MVEDEPRACPKCGTVAVHHAAIRQGKGYVGDVRVSVVEFGWECVKCGHEWGFEYFMEKRLED